MNNTQMAISTGKPIENWIIRFMDKSTITVSGEVGQDLLERSMGKMETFTIKGVLRAFHQVIFLGSQSKYYEQYPDQCPDPTFDSEFLIGEMAKLPAQGNEGIIKSASKNGLEIMIRGWTKTLENHKCESVTGKCGIEFLLAHAKRVKNGGVIKNRKNDIYKPSRGNIRIQTINGPKLYEVSYDEMMGHRAGTWKHPDEVNYSEDLLPVI